MTLRDRAYLLYVVMAFCTHGLMTLTIAGMLQVFLPQLTPTTMNMLGLAFGGLGGLAAAAFAWEFLQIRRYGRFSRPFYLLFALTCISTVAISIVTGGRGYQVAVIALGMTPFLFVGSAIEAWVRGHAAAKWFLVAWTVLSISAGYTALSSLGVAPLLFYQGSALGSAEPSRPPCCRWRWPIASAVCAGIAGWPMSGRRTSAGRPCRPSCRSSSRKAHFSP